MPSVRQGSLSGNFSTVAFSLDSVIHHWRLPKIAEGFLAKSDVVCFYWEASANQKRTPGHLAFSSAAGCWLHSSFRSPYRKGPKSPKLWQGLGLGRLAGLFHCDFQFANLQQLQQLQCTAMCWKILVKVSENLLLKRGDSGFKAIFAHFPQPQFFWKAEIVSQGQKNLVADSCREDLAASCSYRLLFFPSLGRSDLRDSQHHSMWWPQVLSHLMDAQLPRWLCEVQKVETTAAHGAKNVPEMRWESGGLQTLLADYSSNSEHLGGTLRFSIVHPDRERRFWDAKKYTVEKMQIFAPLQVPQALGQEPQDQHWQDVDTSLEDLGSWK